MPSLLLPEELREGDLKARTLDQEYFEANPGARSYVRPFIRGELHPAMLPEGEEPAYVAVAQVRPGFRQKCAVFLGRISVEEAREVAEAEARLLRWGWR